MQDPDAAAAELTRCVNELGFKGAMVNGFTQKGSPDNCLYYDADTTTPSPNYVSVPDNLIDNSLKHGEKVTQIRIYYKKKKGIELIYEDNGVGIPKNEKTKIFQEGYGRGTGYGLYLIKRMCNEYGWTIKETGKHSKGAQFTIIIPETSKMGALNYKIV